jgi:hypothetical protein
MRKKPRGYQAFMEGAKACADGLPMTKRVYMGDRYLRSKWLSGWDQTNTFRENNINAHLKGDALSSISRPSSNKQK